MHITVTCSVIKVPFHVRPTTSSYYISLLLVADMCVSYDLTDDVCLCFFCLETTTSILSSFGVLFVVISNQDSMDSMDIIRE